ncbi:MAG TPA: bifunctional glutamate N-acetyltransferase/amino-acid acetyltransferase ArgJ [Solirubrobacteraceae bacterium]|nr:bifunctional glutamate N-acetyltransferase/amino-acid acetyltransferase ArgJ [Solirubrobacteraceae bacterium]
MSFFASRWVARPAHVRELDEQAPLPEGFRAGGTAAGLKRSGRRDLGLLLCDAQAPASAVALTSSLAPAAPVLVTARECATDRLRAVLVNSGCANAGTGQAGIVSARATQVAAAQALGIGAELIALASTGSIADELPVDLLLGAIPGLAASLSARGASDFTEAIMTTDRTIKRAALGVELPGGEVRLSAQCKGAGMISPRFATMLCFIETDAALAAGVAAELLRRSVARSFERISVDGQLSTNDSVFLIASGASGVAVGQEGETTERFAQALDALLRQLAVMIVADGEGAERIARVRVRGGDAEAVRIAARAVAASPLVKAALHGGDPNWGRIVQAACGALSEQESARRQAQEAGGVLPISVAIEGMPVCAAGAALPVAEEALAAAVAIPEVEYEIGLPGSGEEAEVYFSDLSYEYVRINAEYRT